MENSFCANTRIDVVSYISDKICSYFMRKTSSNPNGYLSHRQIERERDVIQGALFFIK